MEAPGDGQVAAFWDGQPREDDGQYTYGKQPEASDASDAPQMREYPGKTTFNRKKGLKTATLPKQWKEAGGSVSKRARVAFETYQARGGKDLRHEGLPPVAVKYASMEHSIATGMSPFKAAALMSPKTMQAMFEAGYARQEPVRKTKKGKPDKKKLGWEECWHITGNVRINGVMRSYDFTVAKKAGAFELYDLWMK